MAPASARVLPPPPAQRSSTCLPLTSPAAAAAINWTVTNAAETGLPYKLYSTYDILWLDGYNTTAYNAFLYMTALKAGAAMASAVNDTATTVTLVSTSAITVAHAGATSSAAITGLTAATTATASSSGRCPATAGLGAGK